MNLKEQQIEEEVIRVYGKVVITGEHSVLRGGLAVAYPLYNKFLEMVILSLEKIDDSQGFQPIDQKILQRALETCGKSLSDLKENIFIKNSLDGGGLGSSGALCVALGRLMVSRGWLLSSDLFEYCHSLEHFFHGESSGLDIAVILEEKPVSYQREEGARDLLVNWSPYFFISFSGQKSITSQNIKLVQNQASQDLDQKMSYASELVVKALQEKSTEGLPLLLEAIGIAYLCFRRWSLISEALKKHIDQCQKDGAIASKPTGSGGGGYVLSLFDHLPSQAIYTAAALKPSVDE